jgi:phage terminase large subunit-like protein
MTNLKPLPEEAARELLKRRQARKSLLDFIQYVWWEPHEFKIGTHTRAVCDAITDTIEKYLNGISSFMLIAIPFRHGKSDIISRALPAFFLGRCADHQPDIIMSGYGAELVEGFSRDTKKIILSHSYSKLFPHITLSKGSNNIGSWAVKGSTGKVTVSSLGGAITGRGGDLIIVDDYCKNRMEALSETYRKRTWESFRADLMSRRAPVTIVIVCATPWHVDDLRGRIVKEIKNNPDFPRFQEYKYPARDADGKYLFLERYPESWYKEQYATLGKLSAGLMDCEPTLEGGNRFNVDDIKIHDNPEDFPKTRYTRAWDLASSAKERNKDSPDFTVGLLGAIIKNKDVRELWIKDAVYCQAEAPRRDEIIRATAARDGAAGYPQYVEAFGGYKDAYTTLKSLLYGKTIVHSSHLLGDKSAKLAPLEPIFDAGNVHLMKGRWNDLFIKHFAEFPDGQHDDFCDPAAIIYHESARPRGGFAIPGMMDRF